MEVTIAKLIDTSILQKFKIANMLRRCRTCLVQIVDDNFINLKDDMKVRQQLTFCLPEMTLELIINSDMCLECVNRLQLAFNFVFRCLYIEKNLRDYIENVNTKTCHFDEQELIGVKSENKDAIELNDCKLEIGSLEANLELPIDVSTANIYNLERYSSVKQEFIYSSTELYKEETSVEQNGGETNEPSKEYINDNKICLLECSVVLTPLTDVIVASIKNYINEDASNSKASQSQLDRLIYKDNVINNCNVQQTSEENVSKSFKCNKCPYITQLMKSLRLHIKARHSDQKEFECTICNFKTAYKTSFRYHLMTHTCNKPFKCHQCSYTAVHSSNLRLHITTKHMGQKPFKCDVCTYKTAYKFSLHGHRIKKHNLEHVDSNTKLFLFNK